MIISTGVVSVSIQDAEKRVEAMRIGPGEVMGEEGVLAESRSLGEFRSITSGRFFRIERAALDTQLKHPSDLKSALGHLQDQRQGIRQAIVTQKPEALKKSGLWHWLLPRR
nr:hypothetical protein [Pseudomonas gingeri]